MNEDAGKDLVGQHGLPPKVKSTKVVDKSNGPAGKNQSQKNEEQPAANTQRNVATNHDEQKKIINADQSQTFNESEKEGD
jgi:hypothetical protein